MEQLSAMKKKDEIRVISEIIGDAEKREIISYTTKGVAFKWNSQSKVLKETTGRVFHTAHN